MMQMVFVFVVWITFLVAVALLFSSPSYASYLLYLVFIYISASIHIHQLKSYIKSIIFPVYSQKTYPETVFRGIHGPTFPEIFGESMRKLGNVVKYDFIPNNYVMSGEYIREFVSLSPQILNSSKGQSAVYKERDVAVMNYEQERALKRRIGELFSTEYLDRAIEDEGIKIGILISKYIDKYGTTIKPDLIKISDVMDFIISILYENACLKIFGEDLMSNPLFKNCVKNIHPLAFNNTSVIFKYFRKLGEYLEYRKSFANFKKMEKIIGSLFVNSGCRTAQQIHRINAFKIYSENFEISSSEDIRRMTSILIKLLKTMVAIPPSRILNTLVGISVQPSDHSNLIKEQQKVMRLLGGKISTKAISKMGYLDVFVKESLVRSNSASFLFRKVTKDVTLSNGMTIPQESIASINMFSKSKIEKENFLTDKTFDLSQFLNPVNTNSGLVWGYGSSACPFSAYALAQIKVILINIIRNFHIYENADGYGFKHPGFQQISTVVSNNNVLYFKRYNIKNYRC